MAELRIQLEEAFQTRGTTTADLAQVRTEVQEDFQVRATELIDRFYILGRAVTSMSQRLVVMEALEASTSQRETHQGARILQLCQQLDEMQRERRQGSAGGDSSSGGQAALVQSVPNYDGDPDGYRR